MLTLGSTSNLLFFINIHNANATIRNHSELDKRSYELFVYNDLYSHIPKY
jgi:hypothetical protein